jgi:chloride channel protein, CIC family
MRQRLATFAGVALVSFAAAAFAHYFRWTISALIGRIAGDRNTVHAVERSSRFGVGVLVFVGLIVAGSLGRWAQRRWGTRIGLSRVVEADDASVPVLGGSLVRASSVLVAMTSLASLGREAAILETGGSAGAAVGRRLGVRPTWLAASGIAAAFAAAYHAPIGAVFFVREHVWKSTDRMLTVFAACGAGMALMLSRLVFRDTAPFPRANHPLSLRAIAATAACLVPVYVAARVFAALRTRAVVFGSTSTGRAALATRVGCAVAAAVLIAAVPLTSGNGMEAIRRSAVQASLAVGSAMLVAKLAATMMSLATGVPGGVFAPSLVVGAGAAMLTIVVAASFGFGSSSLAWDAIAGTMAVTVLVSVRAPLAAVFVVAELCGDWRLVPISAAVVAVVLLVERRFPALSPKPGSAMLAPREQASISGSVGN